MNPYVSKLDDVPATDPYADVPFYGRYFPEPEDFHVDLQHVNSQSADSLQYWASLVDLCHESIRIYPADEGGRDVFALGSVIVKSSHLHKTRDGQQTEIDYSYADANEVQAVAIAKSVLKDVKVPEIYFSGKVLAPTLGDTCAATSITHTLADQESPGADPGKTTWRWFERCMAISIARPKGVF